MPIQPRIQSVPRIHSLQDMLLHSVRTYGDKLALEDLNETPIPRLTYRSLLKTVLAFGAALQKLGLEPRAHIAVIGENRVQWAVTYLTAACFDYVIVPIDCKLSVNEILNVTYESDADAVVFSEQFETVFRDHHTSLKRVKYYISMDTPKSPRAVYSMEELINSSPGCSPENLPRVNPKSMSVIIFTSGTLGRAKGVMLSQGSISANLMAMLSVFMMYPEDRFLSVLPIHHTYECTCGMLCPLYAGSSVHYARSLKTVSEDLNRVHATILLAVPLLYDKMFKKISQGIQEKALTRKVIKPLVRITDAAEKLGWREVKKLVFKEVHHKFGGSIRSFITGGAAQDPAVARGLRELGFTFIQGYGLTETSPILALNQPENFRDDAAGLPLPGVELQIHQPDAEGVGEVYAKGPNVFMGYYQNPTATEDAFDNEWFKTGDLGFFDPDGFLHICGRKKNVIISKTGKNVFPEEIEDLLNRSPFILESLVYGADDPKLGEVIATQVVVDADAMITLAESTGREITKEMIREVIANEVKRVNQQLGSYKQVRRFIIRDEEFSKTTSLKIKRFANPAPVTIDTNGVDHPSASEHPAAAQAG